MTRRGLAWAKRVKEIESGAVRGPFDIKDVDLQKVAIHPSFPVWERGPNGTWKARNIDNLTASKANDTISTTEAYVPDDLDPARSAVRFAKEVWGSTFRLVLIVPEENVLDLPYK